MVLPRPRTSTSIGMAEDDLEAAFQVFFVRGGRVLGRKGWVVDRVEDLDDATSWWPRSSASSTWSAQEVPPRVLVPDAARRARRAARPGSTARRGTNVAHRGAGARARSAS